MRTLLRFVQIYEKITRILEVALQVTVLIITYI